MQYPVRKPRATGQPQANGLGLQAPSEIPPRTIQPSIVQEPSGFFHGGWEPPDP